jgi:hypothetical protein
VLLIVAGGPLRGVAAGAYGLIVTAAIVAGALDFGFRATIDRPFNAGEDLSALTDAFGVVENAMGTVGAVSVVVLIGVLVVVGAVALARAALRVARMTQHEGRRGRVVVAALTMTWVLLALTGTHVATGVPVAASRAGDELVASSARAVAGIQDLQAFDRAVTADPLASPPPGLLAGLAGKDVVVAFVESYGRVAVEPSSFTADVERALEEGGAALAQHGYSARSAFLTSPTFGGVSWLAHSTLQSGVWVDSRSKYARLMSGHRQTLTGLFDAAGWQTLSVVPSNKRDWDAGTSFYGFDAALDSRNMGYRGPRFGYARVPDQYTWRVVEDQLAESEPVMAEVDLVSSHTPWTPLPRMVPWAQLGDGSVFAPQPALGEPAVEAWADPARVRELYGQSVAYSLDATFSWLATFDQPDLVLVLLGDHQPARIVSGDEAGHDVPITIIAEDPGVFDAIASWGWEDGVRPSAGAPVWRMDEFRDRFVDAFSG